MLLALLTDRAINGSSLGKLVKTLFQREIDEKVPFGDEGQHWWVSQDHALFHTNNDQEDDLVASKVFENERSHQTTIVPSALFQITQSLDRPSRVFFKFSCEAKIEPPGPLVWDEEVQSLFPKENPWVYTFMSDDVFHPIPEMLANISSALKTDEERSLMFIFSHLAPSVLAAINVLKLAFAKGWISVENEILDEILDDYSISVSQKGKTIEWYLVFRKVVTSLHTVAKVAKSLAVVLPKTIASVSFEDYQPNSLVPFPCSYTVDPCDEEYHVHQERAIKKKRKRVVRDDLDQIDLLKRRKGKDTSPSYYLATLKRWQKESTTPLVIFSPIGEFSNLSQSLHAFPDTSSVASPQSVYSQPSSFKVTCPTCFDTHFVAKKKTSGVFIPVWANAFENNYVWASEEERANSFSIFPTFKQEAFHSLTGTNSQPSGSFFLSQALKEKTERAQVTVDHIFKVESVMMSMRVGEGLYYEGVKRMFAEHVTSVRTPKHILGGLDLTNTAFKVNGVYSNKPTHSKILISFEMDEKDVLAFFGCKTNDQFKRNVYKEHVKGIGCDLSFWKSLGDDLLILDRQKVTLCVIVDFSVYVGHFDLFGVVGLSFDSPTLKSKYQVKTLGFDDFYSKTKFLLGRLNI